MKKLLARSNNLEADRRRLLDRLRSEIGKSRVMEAISRVQREAFVPQNLHDLAYLDAPLPIGHGQTISQPTMVAIMTAALEPQPAEKILEIGTGSGYQAAILAELAGHVVTVELIPALTNTARGLLESMGYRGRISVKQADDDVLGYPEEAPFDGIMVTAGGPRVPQELVDQLAPGGRMLIPVGSLEGRDLMLVTRTRGGFPSNKLGPCRFVPLISSDAWPLPSSEAVT